MGVAVSPVKAYSILVVYADTMLTFSVASKHFETISTQCGEIVQACGIIQNLQLTPSHGFESLKAFDPKVVE